MKKGEQNSLSVCLKKEEEPQNHVLKLMGGGDGPDRFTLQHRQNLEVKAR